MGTTMNQNLTEKEKKAHQCISMLASCLKENDLQSAEFFDLVDEFFYLKSDTEIAAKFNEISASYGLTPEIQAKIKMIKTLQNNIAQMEKNYFLMVERAEQKERQAKQMEELRQATLLINTNPYEIYKNLEMAKKAIDAGLINADDMVKNPITKKTTQRHECMLDMAQDTDIKAKKLIMQKDENDEKVFKVLVYISSLPRQEQEDLFNQLKKEKPEIYQNLVQMIPSIASENFAPTITRNSSSITSKQDFWKLMQHQVDTSDVNYEMICSTFEKRQQIQRQMRSLYNISRANAEFNHHLLNHQKNPLSQEAKGNLQTAILKDKASAQLLASGLFMFSQGKENESVNILLAWKNLETPEKRKGLLAYFQKKDAQNYPATLLLMYQALSKERKANKTPLTNNEYERSIPMESLVDCFKDPKGKIEDKKKLLQLIQKNDPTLYQHLTTALRQAEPKISEQLGLTTPTATLNRVAQLLDTPAQNITPQNNVELRQ